MIGGWRSFPPIQDRQPPPPKKDPHIFDGVTVDQHAKMVKATEDLQTMVSSMIDTMPAEQQSTFKNYQKTREESGNQARKPA